GGAPVVGGRRRAAGPGRTGADGAARLPHRVGGARAGGGGRRDRGADRLLDSARAHSRGQRRAGADAGVQALHRDRRGEPAALGGGAGHLLQVPAVRDGVRAREPVGGAVRRARRAGRGAARAGLVRGLDARGGAVELRVRAGGVVVQLGRRPRGGDGDARLLRRLRVLLRWRVLRRRHRRWWWRRLVTGAGDRLLTGAAGE